METMAHDVYWGNLSIRPPERSLAILPANQEDLGEGND
jgi:hypothetical protein